MFQKENIFLLLTNQFPLLICQQEVSLAEYTSMRVGGNAAIMIFPQSIQEAQDTFEFLVQHNIKFFVLGGGSNIIVNDHGVDIVVVNTLYLNKVFCDPENPQCIIAESGVRLSDLSNFALENQLGGLEFSCGIPGTVGGAVFMNAGAYGSEISNVLISTTVFDSSNGIYSLNCEEHQFAYRTSVFSDKNVCILSSSFQLVFTHKQEIQEKIDDFTFKRNDKQPLELPSSGSTFKRPPGFFAGKLIMDAGLQGFTIGGASVSTKHAGFLVNTKNAKAQDFLYLIDHVQKTVYQKYQIMLEPEVKFLEKDGSFRKFH